MPAYNAGRFIAETIDSVLAQSYTNWELIIVNDGSTDDTAAIATQYAFNDKRIRCISQPNSKQGKSRNNGLKLARGGLIAFLDADDLWMPQKLEKQVQAMHETGADAVFTYIKHIDEYGRMIGRGETGEGNTLFYGDEGLSVFFNMNLVPIFTILAKRDAIDAVHGFSEEPDRQNIEDYDLWLRMLLNGSVFLLYNEVLGSYRIHSTQTEKGKSVAFKILRMLDQMSINNVSTESLRKKGMKIWIFRCLRYSISKQELKTVIRLYPYPITRALCFVLNTFMPEVIFKKIMRIMCQDKALKTVSVFIRQRANSILKLSTE